MRPALAATLLLASTSAALPAAPLRFLVGDTAAAEADGPVRLELVAVNPGADPITLTPPARLPATLRIDGDTHAVTLERVGTGSLDVAPGGFATLRYLIPAGPRSATTAVLAIPAFGNEALAIALPESGIAMARAAPPPAPAAAPAASDAGVTPPATERANAFLDNLGAYRPIYAVYGPGTDSDGRLQISFQYQLFGDPATPPAERGPLDRVRFAYTQRMFWDLGRESSPFRNVEYQPEIFYLLPERRLSDRVSLQGQAGFAHVSNGREGPASRSFNMLYAQPMAGFRLGRYTIAAGPRAWLYVGDLEDNPDIRRYRGNLGLAAEIDRDDGLRLSAATRSSVQTGRTSLDAELSYPLQALWADGPNLYLFGQGFAGWGENILDYRRRQARLRVGVGIVR